MWNMGLVVSVECLWTDLPVKFPTCVVVLLRPNVPPVSGDVCISKLCFLPFCARSSC